MASESTKYANDPYNSRGRSSYVEREEETHFITPPNTSYFNSERGGFPNRQSEAPYYHDRMKESPHQESQSYYRGHRPPYHRYRDHYFTHNGQEERHESNPHAALHFPPRHNYLQERFSGRTHLPPPRPMAYRHDHDHSERHSYSHETESPATAMPRHVSQLTPRATLQSDHCTEADPEPGIKQSQSADSGTSLSGVADDSHSSSKQDEGNVKKPLSKSNEENRNMLNDALLLASVAKMARSEASNVPKTDATTIERTVSIDAKDSLAEHRARTPSPPTVNDCKAVTPSLSSKLHSVSRNQIFKEVDSQSIIKNMLSQVSVESTGSLPGDRFSTELKTSASRDQGEECTLPSHPLSLSREDSKMHHHARSPTLKGPIREYGPPPKGKESEDPQSFPKESDPNHRFCPEETYHHSYSHPASRPHETKHDHFPIYRPPTRYEESPRFEEEGRYYRYPLQPMHPYRPPRYSREERPYFHPAASYHRPPIYHGMQPHFPDKRNMDGPLQIPADHYPARRDRFRLAPHRGEHPSHHQGQTPQHGGKIILRRKCAWKNYPELEQFLINSREEYLRHSAMNYTQEQKQYNNELTERLLEVAAKHNYEFDRNDFNFVAIRDRIRCYYKSYVQNCKKRGLAVNYKSNKKQKQEDVTDKEETCSQETAHSENPTL